MTANLETANLEATLCSKRCKWDLSFSKSPLFGNFVNPSISLTQPNVVRFSKFLSLWKADENSYSLQTKAPPAHPLHPWFRNPCLLDLEFFTVFDLHIEMLALFHEGLIYILKC